MSTFSRRDVLRAGGLAAVVGATASQTGIAAASPPPRLLPTGTDSRTFRHGVASGDPLPDGVLLWTRVTTGEDALPGSGRGPDVSVRWEVSTTPSFRRVIAGGTVATGSWRDHTVKAEARGLAAATTYFYRFLAGGSTSATGRTRTAPTVGAAVDRLRMGVVSCANLQAGWFSAYRHLAARDDLDLVLHLGDYLYEYGPGEYQARDVVVRPHDPASEITTLAHYRRRHAQYKTDPDLQALHATAPWVVTWDDHESANDSWSGGAGNHTEGPEGSWSTRQGFSQQAYAEWMPVRYETGGHLYRRLALGSLASVSMLDLRTYRSQQAASPVDPAIADPSRTITGPEQMDFLLDGLADTEAQWKLIGNPVMIAPVRFPSGLSTAAGEGVRQLTGPVSTGPAEGGVPYNIDQWDGYSADRQRVLGHLRDRGIQDSVFLTGDIHSAWACDLPADPATYPVTGDSVATELVCTSVTSDNLDDILKVPPRTASQAVETAIKGANPHIKYLDFDSHGYSVLEVTPDAVRMDWYALSDRTDPRATSTLSTSWRVAAGTQKVLPATGGLL